MEVLGGIQARFSRIYYASICFLALRPQADFKSALLFLYKTGDYYIRAAASLPAQKPPNVPTRSVDILMNDVKCKPLRSIDRMPHYCKVTPTCDSSPSSS